jgi:hypothetical protein
MAPETIYAGVGLVVPVSFGEISAELCSAGQVGHLPLRELWRFTA